MAGKDPPVLCCSPDAGQLCVTFLAMFLVSLAGCTVRDSVPSTSQNDSGVSTAAGRDSSNAVLRGRITVDGSSTVYPITQAAAEDFLKLHGKVTIPVGVAGTGGGFKRFVIDDLDICDASRPIETEEIETCRRNGVAYLELPIGLDGISIVVNPANTWCPALSVAQLKRLWESGSTLRTWNELDPAFPKQDIILYGPDPDSGTFRILHAGCLRAPGKQPHRLHAKLQRLCARAGGRRGRRVLAYFGYAYYSMNRGAVRAVRIVSTLDGARKWQKYAGRGRSHRGDDIERTVRTVVPAALSVRQSAGSKAAPRLPRF